MRVLAVAIASLVLGCSSSQKAPGNVDVVPDAGAADGGGDAGSGSIGGGTCTMPSTLHAQLSGFTTCTCLNGTFALVYDTALETEYVWTSASITGCPGQSHPAHVRLIADGTNNGLGITDEGSWPGVGDSDFAKATSIACAPLAISGAGSQAGNIDDFCPGIEDEKMTWRVGP